MRVTAKKRVSYTSEVTTITCDKCGQLAGRVEDIGTSGPGTHETAIASSQMQRLPYGEQGGDMQRVSFDCCRACFFAHVAPAMVALGFTPREEDVDW